LDNVYVLEIRLTNHLENLEKSRNFTLLRNKSAKLGKVVEIVVCLCCGTTVAIAAK